MTGRAFIRENIKLAAFDLDGTIYNKGVLLDETRNALYRLRDIGVETVIASGRHPFFLPHPVAELECFRYAIGSNGGLVCDIRSREVLFAAHIRAKLAREIVTFLAKTTDMFRVVYDDGGLISRAELDELVCDYGERYRQGAREELTRLYRVLPDAKAVAEALDVPVVKIGCRVGSVENARRTVGLLEERFEIKCFITMGDSVEISQKEISKASGLERLCAYLGLVPENAVVFGDDGNDADIMRRAGFCVAMGNASDDIKELADYITDAVEDDGAGRAIKKLFGV